jgi:hypothetical protein
LAKDYANAQVHPAHIGFVLLNEGSGESLPVSPSGGAGASLFSSVIQKAGGDPVCTMHAMFLPNLYSTDRCETQTPEIHRSLAHAKSTT